MTWRDESYVAWDLETSGTLPEYALQPWRLRQGSSWITSTAAVRKAPEGLVIAGGLRPTREDLEAFLAECVAADRTIVGWHVIFDISWLLALGLDELVFKAKWLDGMLIWKHFLIEPEYDIARGKKQSYGLKTGVAQVLPQHANYADDVDFHSTDPDELTKLHKYNIRDCIFSLRLAKHFWNKMGPKQQKAARIESESLPLVADANLRGMVVDTIAARELGQYLKDKSAKSLGLLAPHGVDETVIRSPAKLAAKLFDDWKLPQIKETPTGSRSTDKEVLHELAFQDERVAVLRTYRDALNDAAKYVDAPLESAEYNGDGRTRPMAIVFGTYSGRWTYASAQGKNKDKRPIGFALHQAKRDPLYRSVISAPKGYTLVEFDAAGQEFRWMAIASGDKQMLRLCQPGEDAHAYMGSRIGRIPYEQMMLQLRDSDPEAKRLRQLGKVANLSLQYRTSARKLRYVARVLHGIDMSEDMARQIHYTYRSAYPGVPAYWDAQVKQTQAWGFVETFGGRRVYVQGNWDGDLGWSMGSTAINYRIQGTGADQKLLALAVLKPYLVSIGARFAWDLHDGLYFYVPEDRVEEALPAIHERLMNLPYHAAWKFQPPVPLPWDCKWGKSWGTLKGWEPRSTSSP